MKFSTAIVLIVGIAFAAAQTPVTLDYSTFDATALADFQLNGNAAGLNPNGDGVLILTVSGPSEAGTAFYRSTIPLIDNQGFQASFSAAFAFSMPNPGGIGDEDGQGADGITFALNTYSNSYGQVGDGIGYGGLPQSIAIEFDTYNNGYPIDINGNHVGIDVNGNIESATSTPYGPRMNNGGVHYAWVDYDGDNQILSARISETNTRPIDAIVSLNINLVNIFGNPNVYVGFTAGTGAGYNQHQILSFSFVNRYRPIGAVTTGVPVFTTGVVTTGAILAPSCPIFDVDCNGLGFSVAGNPVSFLDYAFIALGDFNGNTGDIEGRLAVKGNLNLGYGFSVGAKVTDITVNPLSLVVGGDATWGSGAILPQGSGAYIGGTFTAPADLLAQQVVGSGNLDTAFENARSCYATESAALTTEVDNVDQLVVYGALTLTCADGNAKDYFVTVDGDVISSITDYSLVGCNPGAGWIINVVGSNDVSFNGNNFPSNNGGVYNIVGSGRNINVHTSVGGSILAPNNNLNQNGGTIYGKVVVNNVVSVLQANLPTCPSSFGGFN